MQGALLSQPIGHAFDFLNFLNTEKIPTALFTRNSKKVTEKTLEMHNLKFDICLTRDDVKAKPDPEELSPLLSANCKVIPAGGYLLYFFFAILRSESGILFIDVPRLNSLNILLGKAHLLY